MRGFDDISFGCLRQRIHIVEMTKAAHSIIVRPIEPYQLDPCGHHLISMTIQRGVNEDISSCRVYATVISRFLEGTRQHDCCVGAKMTMSRQAEFVRQRFDAGSDFSKP